MPQLLILGAGTAGTIVANRMRRELPDAWTITIVERSETHVYQPGQLFIPFGSYTRAMVEKPTRSFIPGGVQLVRGEIDAVDPDARQVTLATGQQLAYDQLVIATGCEPRPDLTPGLAEALGAPEAERSVHEFYTLEGALALQRALERFGGGRLVVHLVDLPIKCPVAPLEFAFLTDAHLSDRGIRDATELTYVTPLDGAFTKHTCSVHLTSMLDDRRIGLETDFATDRIEARDTGGALVSYDEREIPFDLLVTVPLNAGQEYIERSGIGDDMNFVPTDKETLRALDIEDVWVIGDASDIPTSKAGSVAHFAADIAAENMLDAISGRAPSRRFDGHANCFIESGHGRALMIDFNYETEPLKGHFPLPRVGPFTLLGESRRNHLGKLAFRHIYWTMLLPARPLPLPTLMTMRGKDPSSALTPAAPPADASTPTIPDF